MTEASFSARLPRCISSVASPPSSRIMFGPSPFCALGAELEDAVRVVPVVGERLALVGEHRRALARRARRRRGPGSRRCCTRPSAPRRRAPAASRPARRSGSSCAAMPAMRAPLSGWVFANSSRIAIRPGISVSAMRISLRPQAARDEVGDDVGGVGLRLQDGIHVGLQTRTRNPHGRTAKGGGTHPRGRSCG